MINLHEWWPVESGFMYIGMNLRQGKATSNLHVRRGINYAINKELIIEELLAGMGRRLCSTFPATSWVYEPNVECYSYNAEKAVAEFEQAGYTFDGEKMSGIKRAINSHSACIWAGLTILSLVR